MTHHFSDVDRFRSITSGDACRPQLINRSRPPMLHHSDELRWKRLHLLTRRIIGFLASQRVAVAASRTRRLQRERGLCDAAYDRAPEARMASRSRT
jgi:hypothetical protein